MATTKQNIGKIPIMKGEYQEGATYQRLNQVTMLGSTYQSKIDGNTSAPAQLASDGSVENINTDKWIVIAVGNVSTAKKVMYNNETSGMEAGNVQEAIDEVGFKVTKELDKKFNKENIAQESGESEDKVMSQKASKRIFRELSNKVSSNCFVLVDDYYIDSKTKLPKHYVGESESRCLYANLLPNRNYIFKYTKGIISINFYNGTIDNATLVESKSYFNGISTPSDYDFCLISVGTYYKDFSKYYFYEANSVTSDKLAANSVTSEKLAANSVTSDKLADNEKINAVPLSLDVDAVTEEWESGLLNNNGEIQESKEYCVSPFIDYSGLYKRKQLLQFKASSPYSFDNVCIYKQDTHEFIGSFSAIGNDKDGILTSIEIYSGISVRICTINKLANWYKLASENAKDAFIRNEANSVTSEKLAANSVTSEKLAANSVTSEKLAANSVTSEKLADAVNKENRSTITLSAENTTLKNGLYTNGGFIEHTSTSKYQSILYRNISDYNKIDISNYTIGVTGGAFLDSDEAVLVTFSSDGGANHVLDVPKDAVTIAITVDVNSKYHDIYGITILNDYYFINLHVKTSQLEYDKPLQISNNQWYGKKLCIIGTSVAHGSNAETAYGYIAQQKLGFTMIPAGVPGQAIHGKEVTYQDGEVQKKILSPLTYGSGALTKEEYASAKAVKDAGLSSDVVGMTIPESPNNPTDWAGESKAYNNYYRTWENLFTAENQDVALWIFATVPNNNNFALDDWNKFDTANWRYKDGSSFADHRTTFLGAMLYLMDKMYENQPKARMVLVLDSEYGYGNTEGKGNMELLSKTFNIPLIDLWSKTNTSPKSKLQTLSFGGTNTHPSTFGHEVMGDIFTNELLLVR